MFYLKPWVSLVHIIILQWLRGSLLECSYKIISGGWHTGLQFWGLSHGLKIISDKEPKNRLIPNFFYLTKVRSMMSQIIN